MSDDVAQAVGKLAAWVGREWLLPRLPDDPELRSAVAVLTRALAAWVEAQTPAEPAAAPVPLPPTPIVAAPPLQPTPPPPFIPISQLPPLRIPALSPPPAPYFYSDGD